MKLELDLARVFLWRAGKTRVQSLRLKTAFAGIFLACFGLFLGTALIGGYHQSFENAILNFNAHVIVKPVDGYFSPMQTEQVRGALKDLGKDYDFVASEFLYWEALLMTENGLQALVLKGIDFTKRTQLYPFTYETLTPSLPNVADGVFIGKNLFAKQPKMVGNQVSVLHLQGSLLKTEPLLVSGTFQTGVEPYDSEFILLDLAVLQNTIVKQEPKPVLGFEIRLHDFVKIHEFAAVLQSILPQDNTVVTWDELNYSLLDGLKLEKTTFTCVGLCILLIACLNVFGFNIMFFLQNRESFRILLLLGYSFSRMRWLFRGISVCVAFAAALAACAMAFFIVLFLNYGPGITFELNQSFVVRIFAQWNWFWIGLFFLGTLVLCWMVAALSMRLILRQRT